MTTAVYASRFLPTISTDGEHEKIDHKNFSTEMRRRLLLVMNLLQRTELLKLAPTLNLSQEGGLYSAAGRTRYGEPYFFKKLAYSGVAYQHGNVEVLGADGRISELELGIFSGDRDFVEGVKTRMEFDLPAWIATGETQRLYIWEMEDVYAIASRSRFLFK